LVDRKKNEDPLLSKLCVEYLPTECEMDRSHRRQIARSVDLAIWSQPNCQTEKPTNQPKTGLGLGSRILLVYKFQIEYLPNSAGSACVTLRLAIPTNKSESALTLNFLKTLCD